MKIKGLYKKRGWYYYRGAQVGGVRPPAIALKTQVEGDAINAVFEMHSEGALEKAVVGGRKRMLEALEEWLIDAKKEGVHRPKTTYITRSCLADLAAHWGDPYLDWIKRDSILEWRAMLFKRPGKGGRTMSEASVVSYLRRLQGFLSWCVRRGYLRKSAMDEVKLPTCRVTKRQQFCTIEQREVLLAAETSEEVRFILYFGFFAGLRYGEMLAMQRDWITEGADGNLVLTVQATDYFKPKNSHMRTLSVHPRIRAFLDGYGMRHPFMLAADRPNWVELPHYRYNSKKQFKLFVTKLGLPWVTYHTLRHSFATHLATKGAAMIEIASALGDTLEVTERNYIGYAPGSESTISAL